MGGTEKWFRGREREKEKEERNGKTKTRLRGKDYGRVLGLRNLETGRISGNR